MGTPPYSDFVNFSTTSLKSTKCCWTQSPREIYHFQKSKTISLPDQHNNSYQSNSIVFELFDKTQT